MLRLKCPCTFLNLLYQVVVIIFSTYLLNKIKVRTCFVPGPPMLLCQTFTSLIRFYFTYSRNEEENFCLYSLNGSERPRDL